MQTNITDSNGTFLAGFYQATRENIAAGEGGAISVTTFHTTISTDSGGDAYTLADGVHIGQLKRISMGIDAGDGVITVSGGNGWNTLIFANAGDGCLLCWGPDGWTMIDDLLGRNATAPTTSTV